MPSLASRILELHAQKKSRDEIIGLTGCTTHYLRSVLSRASAPDEATRRRRTLAIPGSLRAKAQLASLIAWKAALKRGESSAAARKCARDAYRDYLARAAQPASSITSGRQPNQLKEARP
jgi:predicted RNA-binding protein YlqC (UPF0109 family)